MKSTIEWMKSMIDEKFLRILNLFFWLDFVEVSTVRIFFFYLNDS